MSLLKTPVRDRFMALRLPHRRKSQNEASIFPDALPMVPAEPWVANIYNVAPLPSCGCFFADPIESLQNYIDSMSTTNIH